MKLEKDKYYLVENIYGPKKRLNWMISQIDKADTIIEFGCGTGFMIADVIFPSVDVYTISATTRQLRVLGCAV